MKTGFTVVRAAMAITLWPMAMGGGPAYPTPSTTYWSPCVIDFQAFKAVHMTYDNYTSVGEKGTAGGGSAFPNDLGLTVGFLPWESFQGEVGFDWMEPTDDPLLLNAKIGVPEGALFTNAPALEAGVFNVGTRKGVTDLNVVDVVTGRTLPAGLGRLHLAGYAGNPKTLVDSGGVKEAAGFMVAYDRSFLDVKDPKGDFCRFDLAADYVSGRNAIGGGGVGLYYYFTKDLDVLAGPVWFNERALNGRWKWTTQVDLTF